ncbi:pentatricopeptide repeat protein [Aspergillus taichungensis]|uniref:Pentatricopeptide repeat protein n=1 Tax=Aspergillus taichungensis TaxID=482145 RepID=A0A2J5HZ04_9EURO|nr:pentatricopeptide repeat protein [Aspergillus taichungensis]
MLRQAIQGARWGYQHAARRGPPISPLASLRAFSGIAPRSTSYDDPQSKIRFYEQDARDSKTRRRVDPEAVHHAEREELAGEISKIDSELELLKEGPFGPNSEFMKRLPEKEKAIALEAIRKYKEEKGIEDLGADFNDIFDDELDEMIRKEFEGMAAAQENWDLRRKDKETRKVPAPKPYEVTVSEDSEAQAYVAKFNECLTKFAQDSSNERWKPELWRWYRRCRQMVPGFLQSIPDEAMELLWKSQAESSTRAARTTHLQTLAEDAFSVSRSLPTPHILSYIESLRESGKIQKALDQWEAHQVGLSEGKEDLEAYWTLGVRLFAAEDNPQRAQDIALAFLANDKSRQPRVLIPVMTAWARQTGKEADVKAWALYLQLKAFLTQSMTMEDYDRISIGFLKAGKLNLAIAVFKDMMVTGQDPRHDSTFLYKAAVGLAGNLQASSVSEQDVNKISLATLTVLPRRFENRFFYASWMKKLIGMGEVDSAAMVVELMYERGVKPDAKHLNGLIAGWLRQGSAGAREKAERLGWAMIQQRINNVWARSNPGAASPRLQPPDADADTNTHIRIPSWMSRETPPANIETFSVLLLHYTRRVDESMIDYLIKCLEDAHIRANSYFMNHLLYAELRKQAIGTLWHKYQTLSSTTAPDLETFACLWDSGKLQYDLGRTTAHAAPSFPSARGLFAEMASWYDHLPRRAQDTTAAEFSKDLYDQIIRCFCLSKDVAGTLVALHALRAAFGFAPDDTTARLITLQVARHAAVPAQTPSRRLRRLSSTPRSKENIAHVNRLVQILGQRKVAALEARGLKYESLDPAEKEQYQLEIMGDLLRIVMGRTGEGPDAVEGQIQAAAREMGVEGVDLGGLNKTNQSTPYFFPPFFFFFPPPGLFAPDASASTRTASSSLPFTDGAAAEEETDAFLCSAAAAAAAVVVVVVAFFSASNSFMNPSETAAFFFSHHDFSSSSFDWWTSIRSR